MSEIPGGVMAHRPVHLFWLLDCSGSMSINGKIESLNFAVREAIPEIQRVAHENATAQLMVRVITFSDGAQWHVHAPTPIDDFQWSDVTTAGITDLGAALRLVADELQTPPMPERALKPVLVLVSDGQPTDDWRAGLQAVDRPTPNRNHFRRTTPRSSRARSAGRPPSRSGSPRRRAEPAPPP
jgi:uncharacterized protein YegL